jgi:hypothetical protein
MAEKLPPAVSASDQEAAARAGGRVKVRLTLGPALIDLEATLEEIVVVVTRLTQEFTRVKIIGPIEELRPVNEA